MTWLKTPIRNWKQAFAVVLFLAGPILLIVGALQSNGRDAFIGAFELWMAWRLWTVGSEARPAEGPVQSHPGT